MNALADILKGIRPEFDFTTSSNFIADGMLDSFDMVTLVATLDKAYGISIEGVDIVPEHFQNLTALASLLQKYGVKAE
jgi:acyl carrier protein